LTLIEEILEEHEISEDDLESSIETLARDYNKQDGKARHGYLQSKPIKINWTSDYIDATMKVSVEVLRRVYAKLQDQDDDDEMHKDGLNPESHLFFVDAHEMPKWHWSNERGAFERYVIPYC
jgi:DNA polymerase epsilon subunit 2